MGEPIWRKVGGGFKASSRVVALACCVSVAVAPGPAGAPSAEALPPVEASIDSPEELADLPTGEPEDAEYFAHKAMDARQDPRHGAGGLETSESQPSSSGIPPALLPWMAAAAIAGAALVARLGRSSSSGPWATSPLPAKLRAEDAFETEEYAADYGKPLINASSAYARGGSGAGIGVAIVDGMFDFDHPEFIGRVLGCFDATTASGPGREGCTADRRKAAHATHVAGIVGAARDGVAMHGVAWNAGLYAVDIFGGSPFTTTFQRQAEGIGWAIDQGAAVMNHSYGSTFSHQMVAPFVEDFYGTPRNPTPILAAYLRSAAERVIMVWSTGNEGRAEPNLTSALPLYFPELAGHWVAVAAASPDRRLADYSNRCGAAADWCLAAPGGDPRQRGQDDRGLIISTLPDGDYGPGAGTSMATAHVSGAMAVLLHLYGPGTASNMSAKEVLELMFATADSDLPDYSPSVYGHGLLDLAAAMTPEVATAQVPTGTTPGHRAPLHASWIGLGPAFGDALQARLPTRQVTAFDRLNRAIAVDLASFIRRDGAAFDLAAALARYRNRGVEIPSAATTTITFPVGQGDHGDAPSEHGSLLPAVDLGPQLRLAPIDEVGQRRGIHSSDVLQPRHMLDPTAISLPHLAFAGEGTSVGFDQVLGERSAMRLSAFTGWQELPAEALREGLPMMDDASRRRIGGVIADWSHRLPENAVLMMRGGAIIESEATLGGSGGGAFAGGGSTTGIAGVALRTEVGRGINLLASYDAGLTQALAATGLLVFSGPVLSDSMAVGVSFGGLARQRDQFGLVVSQPLRVWRADADLRLAQRRAEDGSVVYGFERLSLTPTGREIRLQTYYTTPVGQGELGLAGLARLEPGHERGSRPEAAAMMQYNVRF